MLDTRDATPLQEWLDQLTNSGLPPLAGIATALREEQYAVAQGITTPYNSGVNEGRITDVKLQKRVMGGRASVPLLRHRVVLIAHLRRHYADQRTLAPPNPGLDRHGARSMPCTAGQPGQGARCRRRCIWGPRCPRRRPPRRAALPAARSGRSRTGVLLRRDQSVEGTPRMACIPRSAQSSVWLSP
nr:hypothetical protein [Streptomyces agglomeratus]